MKRARDVDAAERDAVPLVVRLGVVPVVLEGRERAHGSAGLSELGRRHLELVLRDLLERHGEEILGARLDQRRGEALEAPQLPMLASHL